MPTQDQIKAWNENFFAQLETPGMEKQALDTVNDFTRTRMREDGFHRKIMPPVQIPNDELDRQVDTDKPVKIVDKEPDSPAAISIPFGTMPVGFYIRGPRYRVGFDRIVTSRFTKEVEELRTWAMDIRQVISDNAIKDMLAEEDSKFISGFNTALVGQDATTLWSGTVQWETISGGITRETLLDAFKIMTRTPAHLEVATCLVNNTTIKEVQKFNRNEMGGDFSQDVFVDGWSRSEFMKAKWLITIKRNLVPDDELFMFADPKFMGKFFLLEPTTMFVKREAYLMEFFAYQTAGSAFGHTGGLARASFT